MRTVVLAKIKLAALSNDRFCAYSIRLKCIPHASLVKRDENFLISVRERTRQMRQNADELQA